MTDFPAKSGACIGQSWLNFSDKCANAKNEVELLKSKKDYLISHLLFIVTLTADFKVSLQIFARNLCSFGQSDTARFVLSSQNNSSFIL